MNDSEQRALDVHIVLFERGIFIGLALFAFLLGVTLWVVSTTDSVHCAAASQVCTITAVRGGSQISTTSVDLQGARGVHSDTRGKVTSLVVASKIGGSRRYPGSAAGHTDAIASALGDFLRSPKADLDVSFDGQTLMLEVGVGGVLVALLLLWRGFAPVWVKASRSGERIHIECTRWWRLTDDVALDAIDIVGAEIHRPKGRRARTLRIRTRTEKVTLLGGPLPEGRRADALAHALDFHLRRNNGSALAGS